MKEKISDSELRDLLCRWYEGETSVKEERLLKEIFSSSVHLPDDIESEREIFRLMNQAEDVVTEMPHELESRISAAVNNEIEKDSKAVSLSSSKPILWRRISLSAASVAAVFALVFSFRYISDNTENRIGTYSDLTAYNAGQVSLEDDTLTIKGHYLSSDHGYETLDYTYDNKVEKTAVNINEKAGRQGVGKGTSLPADSYMFKDSLGGSDYLTPEEEAMLAKRNYHVVKDSREAEQILTDIFSRLEDRMEVQEVRLSHIETDYINEVYKVTGFEDSDEIIKKCKHELRPL